MNDEMVLRFLIYIGIEYESKKPHYADIAFNWQHFVNLLTPKEYRQARKIAAAFLYPLKPDIDNYVYPDEVYRIIHENQLYTYGIQYKSGWKDTPPVYNDGDLRDLNSYKEAQHELIRNKRKV